MSANKIKVKHIYDTLDGYSHEGLVDRRNFVKALSRDLRIRLDDIDFNFLSMIYRDKKDSKNVRYSQFIDDLKQKFELTETYIVPGYKRKQPDHKYDDILRQTKMSKSFDIPIEVREKEIREIIKKLRAEAHNQRVNLREEFKK